MFHYLVAIVRFRAPGPSSWGYCGSFSICGEGLFSEERKKCLLAVRFAVRWPHSSVSAPPRHGERAFPVTLGLWRGVLSAQVAFCLLVRFFLVCVVIGLLFATCANTRCFHTLLCLRGNVFPVRVAHDGLVRFLFCELGSSPTCL